MLIKEKIQKIIQEVYIAGDEGQPEESAVPSAVSEIDLLYRKEMERKIKNMPAEIFGERIYLDYQHLLRTISHKKTI